MGAYVKVRAWQLFLIKALVIPILKKLAQAVEAKATETPEKWDDVAAAALTSAVEVLESGQIFEET